MKETDRALARIDEVLGIADDMSIEWDHHVSGDAMRSRPSPRTEVPGRWREGEVIAIGFDGSRGAPPTFFAMSEDGTIRPIAEGAL